MKKNNIISLVTIPRLIFVFCLAFAVNVPAQNTAKRAGAGKMLIENDTMMLEQRRRNSLLPPIQRREIESAMSMLSGFLNGTWELVERTVSNNETRGRTILVPTEGRMVFNLKPNGTQAGGDLLIMEQGLGNLAITDGLENNEPFVLASYNEVQFEGSFEVGPLLPQQQRRIVISEQLIGEILGSYGSFRQPTVFRQVSTDLPIHVMSGKGSRTSFVSSSGKVIAPSGRNNEGSDNWDISRFSNNVMILGISERGILDIWKKTSNNVQMDGQPLRRSWETLKRSGRLLKPTFKAEQ